MVQHQTDRVRIDAERSHAGCDSTATVVDFPSQCPVEALTVAVLPGTAGMDPYRFNADAAELRSLGMSERGEAELRRGERLGLAGELRHKDYVCLDDTIGMHVRNVAPTTPISLRRECPN